MILRRLAFAVALLLAALASQLPEFAQQYRQRLGGAIDELSAVIDRFDQEAGDQSLTRQQGIARLRENTDVLAQQRGTDVESVVARRDRLERQRLGFKEAGPLSEYWVMAEDFDPAIGHQALADYQPAIPVTPAGFVSGAVGFIIGFCLMFGLAHPFRRRPAPAHRDTLVKERT